MTRRHGRRSRPRREPSRPALSTQLLIRDPARIGAGIRIGNRLYGALDMTLGPRASRPFAELMERLAEADLACRFSILIEGGGLRRLGAGVARVASAFLAFSHPDSRAVRDAMRHLAEQDAAARAVVRLRLGLLTWVSPEEGEEQLARRLGRLQQLAEGWGEAVFSPLVGDQLEAFAGAVPGFCCGGTAEPALAPLPEALRLLPVCRPAPLARHAANHIFRAPDGKMLPWSCEEGEDHGFELIHGIPGRGKSVLMNSLTLAHILQGGQARLPLAATIDIGPSSSGLISLVREALPPERRAEAGWFPLRMSAAHAINPCDTQLGCRMPLPAERAFLENLLGLILTPAGAAGVPDGMRELIGPTVSRAYLLRSDRIAGAEPNAYAAGRDADVDRALERAGLRPGDASWWEAADLLFDAGDAVAASRAQRYAVPVLGDFLARGARACGAGPGGRDRAWDGPRDRDAGLHPHRHRARRQLARHVRPHRLRHRVRPGGRRRSARGGAPGLGRGRPPDCRLLHAGPPRAHPPLVDRRRKTWTRCPSATGVASQPSAGDPGDAEAPRLR